MAQARAGSQSQRRTRRRRAATSLRRALRRQADQIWNAWRSAPWQARLTVAGLVLALLWIPVNFTYQVAAKPSELLAPLGSWLIKTPEETWQSYAPLFRRNATANVSAELLAALAQAESAGNPAATTYWHWRFSLNPLAIYRPASSSVGLYQMTDAAYTEARRYCILHHRLADDRAASDAPAACGQGGAYWRIMPGDAVALTAAYLDRYLGALLAKHSAAVKQQQKDDLAAVLHLCGPGPAGAYARRGFHLTPGERCGDQDVAVYVARISGFARRFRRLAQGDASAS